MAAVSAGYTTGLKKASMLILAFDWEHAKAVTR